MSIVVKLKISLHKSIIDDVELIVVRFLFLLLIFIAVWVSLRLMEQNRTFLAILWLHQESQLNNQVFIKFFQVAYTFEWLDEEYLQLIIIAANHFLLQILHVYWEVTQNLRELCRRYRGTTAPLLGFDGCRPIASIHDCHLAKDLTNLEVLLDAFEERVLTFVVLAQLVAALDIIVYEWCQFAFIIGHSRQTVLLVELHTEPPVDTLNNEMDTGVVIELAILANNRLILGDDLVSWFVILHPHVLH